MARRNPEDMHRRIFTSFSRLAKRSPKKLRNQYLKLLLRYQLLTFQRN